MAGTPRGPATGDPRSAKASPPAARARRGSWLRRIALGVAALVLVAIVAAVVVLRRAQPVQPGSFYTAPSPLPSGPPGTIVRSEPLEGLPAGAKGWRILYLATGYTGKPVAVSAVVISPDTAAPPGGRHVVAWSHGTVGTASNCATSLLAGGGAIGIDGLPLFLAAGDAVVATDYQGLGTPGPNPYLVGKAEAIDVLDSVRAAHNLKEAGAGTDFVVWGASQGGHASLFTGQYAASYAPDLTLLGVAAAAPATDLVALFKAKIGTDFGNLLAAYSLDAWSRVYGPLTLDQVVTAVARPIVRSTASYCIQSMTQALPAVLHARVLKITFLSKLPWDTEPWKTELEANTAGRAPIPAPLFIAQGAADPLVLPAVQASFVAGLCKAGQRVEYRTYAGVQHVEASVAAASDAAAWIADRFAGKPAPSTCH